jgi:hypothetical protein
MRCLKKGELVVILTKRNESHIRCPKCRALNMTGNLDNVRALSITCKCGQMITARRLR